MSTAGGTDSHAPGGAGPGRVPDQETTGHGGAADGGLPPGSAPSERVILHADMDAFFAAVEQRDHPEWRGKPLVVGGAERRGVVATCSYEARAFGVHSAMPGVEARRRCPGAIFVPPRMAVYRQVSAQIQDIFQRFTPLVEPLSLDEAFLDVSGSLRLFGSGEKIARLLKTEVNQATGLTVSVGVAACKYVAKVASDLGKPDGLVCVPADGVIAFLEPLPVARLWGAGQVTQQRLQAAGGAHAGRRPAPAASAAGGRPGCQRGGPLPAPVPRR